MLDIHIIMRERERLFTFTHTFIATHAGTARLALFFFQNNKKYFATSRIASQCLTLLLRRAVINGEIFSRIHTRNKKNICRRGWWYIRWYNWEEEIFFRKKNITRTKFKFCFSSFLSVNFFFGVAFFFSLTHSLRYLSRRVVAHRKLIKKSRTDN